MRRRMRRRRRWRRWYRMGNVGRQCEIGGGETRAESKSPEEMVGKNSSRMRFDYFPAIGKAPRADFRYVRLSSILVPQSRLASTGINRHQWLSIPYNFILLVYPLPRNPGLSSAQSSISRNFLTK
jgi:hypothetical protein